MGTGKNDELEPDFDAVAPAEDEDVWFDGNALARESAVELGGQGLLRPGYGREDLAADRGRRGLDLGGLPPWPGGPPSGHGWGPALSGLVGGVRPGQRLLVSAPGPGHGRTGFVLQLADGLALRNLALGEHDPLTPVIVVSEDGREDAGRRRLARWTGHEARVFRHGREGAERLQGWSGPAVERAFADAEQALAGELGSATPYARHLSPHGAGVRGPELVGALSDAVAGWCSQLGAQERALWPVVVVDGLRSLVGDVCELEVVVEALSGAVRRGGWILLATERETGSRLDPWFDLRLELEREAEAGHVHAQVAHHRGGPTGGRVRYAWSPRIGRYEPVD